MARRGIAGDEGPFMTGFVAWIWQGAALTAVIAVLLRGMPRLNAATRHACWWGALAGIALLGFLQVNAALSAVAGPAAATSPGSAEAAVTLPPLPAWFGTLALGGWLAFVAYHITRVILALRHVAALRAHARPIAPGEHARLPYWSHPRTARRHAELCLSDSPVGACALGFRRPVILVSQQLWDSLDDEVLDQVVLHEQGHLDRFDDWLRLAQSLITALIGVHPAVHIIGRRLDLEREAACDDRVVSITGTACAYASGLTQTAAVAAGYSPTVAPAALGAASSSASPLRARIVRLLEPGRDRSRRVAWPVTATVTTIVATALAGFQYVDPVVAFDNAPMRWTAVAPIPAAVLQAAPALTAATRIIDTTIDAPSRHAAPTPRSPVTSIERAKTQEPEPPAAPAPSVDAVLSSSPNALADLVGQAMVADSHSPALRTTVDDLAPASPGQPGVGTSLVSDASKLGLNSATKARRMGLSVAGAFTRAGKAIGNSF
jgi:beta-lactamase regulating signal transducer with metallopeptidase domain